MSVIEIVAGALLLVCCILIVAIVLMQDGKGSGLSGVIMGGDSYAGTAGRTNAAKMAKLTKILAAVFFVVTLVVNIIALSAN